MPESSARFSSASTRKAQPWLVGLLLLALALGLGVMLMPPGEDSLAQARRGEALRVGFAVEAPYVVVDADGRVHGEAPAVLAAALQRAGINKIEWLHSDFGSLLHELEAGRIQIIASGMFITPQREARVLFSRPTARVHTGLLLSDDLQPAPGSLAELAARSGVRLAVLGGAVEATLAQQAGLSAERIVAYPDPQAAVQGMIDGRVAALALSSVSLRYLQATALGPRFRLVDNAAPDAPAGLPAFAFRREDKALRDLVDRSLAGFIGSPEHLALIKPYGFTANDLPPRGEAP